MDYQNILIKKNESVQIITINRPKQLNALNKQTINELNKVIEKIMRKIPNAKFFIFCTFNSPILRQLNLPNDSFFLTKDNGYDGNLEILWLLSNCKNHIFTNSSFALFNI